MKASATTGDKIWILDGNAASIETAFVALEPLSEADAARIPERIERRDLDGTVQRVLGVTFKPLDQTGVYEYIAGNPGKHLSLTVLRGTETVRLSLVPKSEMARVEKVSEQGKLGQPHGTVGRMGVTLGPELQRTGVLEGLVLGAKQSVASVYTVVYSFKLMLNRTIEAEPTGTIGIMAMTAETAKLGWAAVLSFCGLISANLAVLNMFPIPPFDGFHVVLLGLEGLLGRRVNEKLEVYVRLAGFLLIINLFVLLTAKDVLNLIKYGTY
jgi:regulator of sigma E protease